MLKFLEVCQITQLQRRRRKSSYGFKMWNNELKFGQNIFTLGRQRKAIYQDTLIYDEKKIKNTQAGLS